MVSACLLKTNRTVVVKLRRDNHISRSIDFSKTVMLGRRGKWRQKWYHLPGSNRGPLDPQSSALTS